MPKVSFDVPVEVKKSIAQHKAVQWDRVVTDAIWNYAKKLELLESIAGKSRLDQQSADSLNKSIKAKITRRYRSTS